MGYRSELDAAQARIRTLEAQLKERDAALEAREAEVDELRRGLEQGEAPARAPKRPTHAAAYAVSTLLGATLLLGGWTGLHYRTRPIEMTSPTPRTTYVAPTLDDRAATPQRDARRTTVDRHRCDCSEGDATCQQRCKSKPYRGKEELGF